MPTTTQARSAALGKVCRLVTAATRHEQLTVSVEDLGLALEGVDVEGLAVPRPLEVVCNVDGVARRSPVR